MTRRFRCLLALWVLCVNRLALAEDDRLVINAGAGGIFDPAGYVFGGVEYQPACGCAGIRPWFFLGGGEQGLFYAAAGGLMEVPLGEDWILTPAIGVGYYQAQDPLDLGCGVEFRSSLELARRLANSRRLGLGIAHLSNASLGRINPGTEWLYLSWSFPL